MTDHPPAGLAAQPAPVRGPLAVSGDRRRILDATAQSVLFQGDAPWSLIANCTLEEVDLYLDARQRQGFNALLVNLVEHLFSADPPRDRAGDEPFTVPGDFRTPNEAYMAHAERVLEACRRRGFVVFLYPTFLGYPDPHYPGYGGRAEGWYDEVVANGVDGCRAYGRYLAERFGAFENVIWSIGADRDPDEARAGLDAMATAIRAGGRGNLMTAQMLPEHTAADEWRDAEWLDLLSTYSYEIVPRALERDWRASPRRPFFLVESAYENEHDASALQIRRAAYWSVLFGGNGHCMGVKPVWMFGPGWQDALDTQGARDMSRFGTFFRSIRWWDLVPDLERALVSAGRGEARGLDQVGAAFSADRELAVVYIPDQRAVTIETDALAGPSVAVSWFEPQSGRSLDGGRLVAGGPAVVMPPFPLDSVLLLQSTGG